MEHLIIETIAIILGIVACVFLGVIASHLCSIIIEFDKQTRQASKHLDFVKECRAKDTTYVTVTEMRELKNMLSTKIRNEAYEDILKRLIAGEEFNLVEAFKEATSGLSKTNET